MADFFKKIVGDKGKNKSGDGGGMKNPFAKMGGPKKFSGQGQSLGGSQPGEVFRISFPNPGSLGLKVEKTRQGGAIVAAVQPNSQASNMGLERGDVLCHAGTEGSEEMHFDQFMALAASDRRPLPMDVRRIPRVDTPAAHHNNGTASSADAFARRQAVVAAAEARDKKNRAWSKPVARSDLTAGPPMKTAFLSTADRKKLEAEQRERKERMEQQGPQSDRSRQAVEAAKRDEERTVEQMGFNMYEVGKMTGGQAKNATVDHKVGKVDAGSVTTTHHHNGGPTSTPAPGTVRPPAPPTAPLQSVDEAFDYAFTTVVSSGNVVKSVSTMRRLLLNATSPTKGRLPHEQDGAKFRRVRLSNDKIRDLIVTVTGALDLMMLFGFVPLEEGQETFLVWPFEAAGPVWLEAALERMERYEKHGD